MFFFSSKKKAEQAAQKGSDAMATAAPEKSAAAPAAPAKPVPATLGTMVIRSVSAGPDGTGCTVSGTVRGDSLHKGDAAYLIGRGEESKVTVRAIEIADGQLANVASSPCAVSLRLEGIAAANVHAGDVLSAISAQSEINVNDAVENPRLSGLLSEVAAENDRGVLSAAYEELALRAHLLAVVTFSVPPRRTGDNEAIFDKGSTLQFPGLARADGSSYFPLFTDWRELRRWPRLPASPQTMILRFDDIVALALKDGSNAGIVLNPFGASLTIPREQLSLLCQQRDLATKGVAKRCMEKDTPVRIGEPAQKPQAMLAAVADAAKTMPEVKRLWLRLMEQNGEFSWLVVVEHTEKSPDALFAALAAAAKPYLTERMLDMVGYDTTFGKSAAGDATPFYQKG